MYGYTAHRATVDCILLAACGKVLLYNIQKVLGLIHSWVTPVFFFQTLSDSLSFLAMVHNLLSPCICDDALMTERAYLAGSMGC